MGSPEGATDSGKVGFKETPPPEEGLQVAPEDEQESVGEREGRTVP